MTFVLFVEGWIPATLNSLMRGHWSKGHRLKRSDRQVIGLAARLAGVPRATNRRRVNLRVTLERGKRAPDPDALWKSTLDALVHAGALRNDSAAWCVPGEVTFGRGPRRATRIELEDVGGEA